MNYYLALSVLLANVDVSQLTTKEYKPKYHPTSDYVKMDTTEQADFDIGIDQLIEFICFQDGRITRAGHEIFKGANSEDKFIKIQVANAENAIKRATVLKQRATDLFEKLIGKPLAEYECRHEN